MKEVFSKKIIVPAILIAILYVMATIYLMNAGLVRDALLGDHSLGYKWNLLIALLAGMWTAMSRLSLMLLVIVAILTGLNLVLTTERLRTLRASGKIHLAVGGSSLLGIIGSGCASCGLPVLALVGLSGAIAYLPFRGVELSIIAIALLGSSLYFLLKSRTKEKVCEVNNLFTQKI
jgi:hypothetical protein